MPSSRTPLFVRLPRDQATALDRLANATGRHKQHLVSELLADRLTPGAGPVPIGRIEVANTSDVRPDEVLLTVRNDGAPFSERAVANVGMGLRYMRHRASVIGATLTIRADDREGTTVRCVIPVSADAVA